MVAYFSLFFFCCTMLIFTLLHHVYCKIHHSTLDFWKRQHMASVIYDISDNNVHENQFSLVTLIHHCGLLKVWPSPVSILIAEKMALLILRRVNSCSFGLQKPIRTLRNSASLSLIASNGSKGEFHSGRLVIYVKCTAARAKFFCELLEARLLLPLYSLTSDSPLIHWTCSSIQLSEFFDLKTWLWSNLMQIL